MNFLRNQLQELSAKHKLFGKKGLDVFILPQTGKHIPDCELITFPSQGIDH